MIQRLAVAIAGAVVAVAVQTSATAGAVPGGSGGSLSLEGRPAPLAPADCEHRGTGHWEGHGRLEDDRYHLARGERITCHDNGEPREDHAGDDHTEHHLPGHDTHRWWRND